MQVKTPQSKPGQANESKDKDLGKRETKGASENMVPGLSRKNTVHAQFLLEDSGPFRNNKWVKGLSLQFGPRGGKVPNNSKLIKLKLQGVTKHSSDLRYRERGNSDFVISG